MNSLGFGWPVIFENLRQIPTKTQIVPFSSETLKKLEQASSSPHAPTMDDEDAKLLNYLQVSDFRWPYKYYKTEKDVMLERIRSKPTCSNFASSWM